MTIPSLRLPIALTLGATLMAWRGYEIAPIYSAIQIEMVQWVLVGSGLLVVGLFWELARWYQQMDRRYLPKR